MKPERGIIEDFFKVAKDAFGLGEFHSYTSKSMVKNILLGFLLTTMVVQLGFKTKTQLQRLSEGFVDFEPPKTSKNVKKDDETEIPEEKETVTINEPQQKLITGIKDELINLFNYSSRVSSKSKTKNVKHSKNSNKVDDIIKSYFKNKLRIQVFNPLFSGSCN